MADMSIYARRCFEEPEKFESSFTELVKTSRIATNVIYQTCGNQAGFDMVQAWRDGETEDCLIVELTETNVYGDPQQPDQIDPATYAKMRSGEPAPMSLPLLLKKKQLVDQQLDKCTCL